jgi:hypothetical protein
VKKRQACGGRTFIFSHFLFGACQVGFYFLMILNLLRFYMNFFFSLKHHISVCGEVYVKNLFFLTI